MCIALCNYLSNKCGRKACYIELNATDEIRFINPIPYERTENRFSYKGIDFYPSVTLQTLSGILRLDYEFFILDFGTLNPYTTNEYERSNYKYAICPLPLWKRRSLYDFTDMLHKKYNKYQEHITLIGYTEIKERKEIKIMKDMVCIPFFRNPFQIASDEFVHLERVLERNNISR